MLALLLLIPLLGSAGISITRQRGIIEAIHVTASIASLIVAGAVGIGVWTSGTAVGLSGLLQADALRDLGRTLDAESALDRALAISDTVVMGLQRVDVLRALGILRRRAGRADAAIEAYREALVIAREHKARLYEARINNALSYAMLVCGRYEETIAYALEAIRIDLEVGGHFQVAKTLTNLGHAAARLGDYARASDYFAHARSAHVRVYDEEGYADTLLVSAAFALEYESLEIARGWLSQARSHLPKASHYDRVHEQLVTSLVSLMDSQWGQAASAAQAAALLATKLSLFAFEGYALSVLAVACAKLSKVSEAKIAIARARAIAESTQKGEFLIESLGMLVDATALVDHSGHDALSHHLARALAECEARISTQALRQAFRDRPLIRNLLLKTRPSAVSSLDEARSSRPIG